MQFLYWLEAVRAPVLDAVMQLVTYLGGEIVFMAAAIIMFWCVNKRCGYYMLTVGFAGTVLNQFLKLWFRVPRPWVRDPDFTIVESARAGAAGYSFPSGHTQSVFAALGAPARYFKHAALRVLLVTGIALTAFSRMYLGVHTPLDVGASLLTGVILVFGLYPLFRDVDRRPGRLYVVFFAFILAAAGYLLFTLYYAFPADIDPDELALGIKNGWMMLFCAAALLIVWHVDRQYLRFPVTAPLWAQLVKVCVGFGIILLIRVLLKQPLLDLCNGSSVSDGIRYFLMIIFAGIIWPLTFAWFSKRPRVTRNKRRQAIAEKG